MIPSSELDEVSLKAYMDKSGVQAATVERATRFFNQCLSVRYGGIPGGFNREEMLRECRELTSLLE
jgi:hypothetical protein